MNLKKNLTLCQNIFMKQWNQNQWVVNVSFLVSKSVAEMGKMAFTIDQLIKEWNFVKKKLLNWKYKLPVQTILRKISCMSNNLVSHLLDYWKKYTIVNFYKRDR